MWVRRNRQASFTRASPSGGMRRSPVLETLAVMLAVFVLQVGLGVLGLAGTLAASAATIVAEPWTLATSVYAHAGPGHLVANAVALAVVGPLVARRTTRLLRYDRCACGVRGAFGRRSPRGAAGRPRCERRRLRTGWLHALRQRPHECGTRLGRALPAGETARPRRGGRRADSRYGLLAGGTGRPRGRSGGTEPQVYPESVPSGRYR